MSIILLIIIVILFLAIIGIGWETFFAGIIKGIDKITNTSIITNSTNSTKDTFGGDLSNSSTDIPSADSSR